MSATRISKLVCILAAAASTACAPARAQQEAGAAKKLPPVTVTASPTRGAVEKSYRKMIAGMDLFERLHGMAPAASLRFKLLPRKRDTDMEHINLEILGDTIAIPVRVAADHTFTLERYSAAPAENAAETSKRRGPKKKWG